MSYSTEIVSAGHRRSARNVAVVMLAALTLSIAVTTYVTTSPASAGVTCYGDYCSGKDPSVTGCDRDAYTVAHTYIPGTKAKVELRWSPTCKTNWARVPASWGRAYPTRFRAVQSTGYTQAGMSKYNTTYAWTRMIYSPKLCVSARWTGAPGYASTACA